MTAPTVVVIGGGLAGISASIGLADAGFDVTLMEARPRLGGAASSYQRGSLTVDNGQHVFLRCCESYRGLLDRLGATGSVSLQERFDVTVLSEHGSTARLRRTDWPAPLHLGPALAGYRMLSLADRLRVGRAALAMRFLDPSAPSADSERLGDWLAARGQSARARRALWDLFVVSALNIDGDDASLPLAATVIKTGLLGDRGAADIGIASVPLGDIHGRAATDLLTRLGVRVVPGAKAGGVRPLADGGFAVDLVPGRTVAGRVGPDVCTADGVVLAIPSGPAARLAAAAGVPDAVRWEGLGTSPIINIHVIYDRPVTGLPFAAAIDSPVQWVFDKTANAGLANGQYLAVSVSAAQEYIDVPSARLREVFVPALERLFPTASSAAITDFFVTRERRATFRQAPGCVAIRPGAATSVPGLVLAGSWTDTGWPDTMEGAVRSGQSAAQELTGQLRRTATGSSRVGSSDRPRRAASASSGAAS